MATCPSREYIHIMALRTVNPWLDHRHDARHVAALMLLATRCCRQLIPNLRRAAVASQAAKRHPQGANSDPKTRPLFLKLRLHPIVARAAWSFTEPVPARLRVQTE